MKPFKKFSMYDDEPTTASDSTGSNMKTAETAEEWLKENNCMNDLVHLKAKIKTSDAMQAYAHQQVNKKIDEIKKRIGFRSFDVDGNHVVIEVQRLQQYLTSLKTKQP